MFEQAQDEKANAVNQQLNMFENNQLQTEDAEKQFSGATYNQGTKENVKAQPDAEKVFVNTNIPPDAPQNYPTAQVAKTNTQTMLKNIFNPDPQTTSHAKHLSKVINKVHTFDIGGEVYGYSYQEPHPVGIKIQGPMVGYYMNYAYRPADPNFFNNFISNVYMFQARYSSSKHLEYSGDGIVKNKHDENMEFRGLIGKDYFIGANTRVTPYFGFGYRYLIDHGNGQLSNIGGYGYDRKSHYYYLPLGADTTIWMSRNWEIDINGEYDILMSGYQKSFLSNGDQFNHDNNPDIINHQDHGFGVRGSIKFLKHGSLMDYYVEPYIRFWNIDQSKVAYAVVDGSPTYGVEPKNNTTEIGSRFGVQF